VGYKYRGLVLPCWGLGVGLTTSSFKKKFVENLLREKMLEEAKAPWAVVPLMMMMIYKYMYTLCNKNKAVEIF
jgi:hypothetical protein